MNVTEYMNEQRSWRGRLIPLATIALALPLVIFEGKAQAQRVGEAKTIQGHVQSLTAAPMGEADGAVLDDGTVVHWPPHLADRFTAIVAKDDRVRVVGKMETGPAGDAHLEAESVTNLRTNASAENDSGPPPPPNGPGRRVGPPPPGPLARRGEVDRQAGRATTAQGRVRSLTTAPMGEVDGAVLDDGTVVHWPPHLAHRFTPVVAKDDRIKVSGWIETGPTGDTHVEVQKAVNIRTNASASADDGPSGGRLASDDSGDFAPSRATTREVERRLKNLEDQIAQLREEIQRLRDEL